MSYLIHFFWYSWVHCRSPTESIKSSFCFLTAHWEQSSPYPSNDTYAFSHLHPHISRPDLEIFCSPTIFSLYNLYHIGPISKMTQASTLRQQREVERALNTPEQGGYFFHPKLPKYFFIPKTDFYKLDAFYSRCNILLEILIQSTLLNPNC